MVEALGRRGGRWEGVEPAEDASRRAAFQAPVARRRRLRPGRPQGRKAVKTRKAPKTRKALEPRADP